MLRTVTIVTLCFVLFAGPSWSHPPQSDRHDRSLDVPYGKAGPRDSDRVLSFVWAAEPRAL